MAAPRGVSPLPRRATSDPCTKPETEIAALRAEVAKLRRQASASRREVAVWRELALREKCCLTELPAELLQHIAVRIQLAHHIARAAPTCRVISVAARTVLTKERPFSGEVVTLPPALVADIEEKIIAREEQLIEFTLSRFSREMRQDLGPRDAFGFF